MHPSRRRKKRPNYGIRTVEVIRGPNGFGFTISGQQPCILSCIVTNSPADQAGLRAGDFLISVNGISVSKSTHDSVVNLIGNSIGPIKMTIAENYYSDSSDEDIDVARMISNRKPKYMHRPRMHRNHKQEASTSANDRLTTNNHVRKVARVQNLSNKSPLKQQQEIRTSQDNNEPMNVSPLLPRENDGGPVEYKALVGYLGTIEMPKQLLPSARLQTVCSCIRKLRQEKRTPTTVLMTVLPTCLTLKNASNQILAIYPTSRVVYISSSTDKDSRYFGLVTSAICDNRVTESVQKRNCQYFNQSGIWSQKNTEKPCNNTEDKTEIEISNSCHVFVTDSKLIEHSKHTERADQFRITCSPDIVAGNCLEFPKNALYIVSLVQNMYKLQDSATDQQNRNARRYQDQENLLPVMANSPQPSASSNSDSGIGFRDDCGNISDRILVVEFPAQQHLPIIASNSKRPSGIDASSLLLENLDAPLDSNNSPEFPSGADLNNVRCKNFEFRCSKNSTAQALNNFTDNKENKQNNNINNIRAHEVKNEHDFKKPEVLNELEHFGEKNLTQQNQNPSDFMSRLTVRAMPDPIRLCQTSYEDGCRSADIDTGQIFTERPIDVPENSPSKKSFETVSMHSTTDDVSDFKSSIDNVSMHSSKSLELRNVTGIFKTPSTKYLGNKKSVKRHLKMIGSYDNLVAEKYENSIHYKLSPKVYGMSKPNYSCEELTSLDNIEKCGYGSLQDLCSLIGQNGTKRNIAQSEPDVRLQRRQKDSEFLCEENGVQNSKQAQATASWATSFEKLLEDPVGLQTFAEFLKKEFSAENIYFWTACERFRRLPPGPERVKEAQRIYQRHLCVGAPEPVNVDSQGRQCTEQSLQEADPSLFEQAQKQIFNLMKFDSYPRFLKSDLYKQCLSGHVETSLDAGLLVQPATSNKLKKSLSNAEDRRRKSLLPWHRKNRSKSKDRGETEYQKKDDHPSELPAEDDDKHDAGSDVHSSKSSLTSQESSKGLHDDFMAPNAAGRGPLCRVILCNGSTTVVQIKQTETIEQLVNRVLDKRGITYSSFEVYTDKHSKPLNICDSSTALAGCEVRIEQRVIFKLDLPNRKVIAVKSKYTKILIDVLKPILNKYGFRLEQVRVSTNTSEPVDVFQQVTAIDGMRLNIQLCDELKEQAALQQPQKINSIKIMNSASLDEITNKVFKELLHEKAEIKYKSGSDRGSVKSEDWGSENSSGLFGRFLRRDSGIHEKKKKCLVARGKGNSNQGSVEDITGEHSVNAAKKPLIAKWKSGVNKLHVGCSESEKLYEGLNRAQNSRIEDQRGTEINFELPDFLKDKENAQLSCNRNHKFRLPDSTKFYDAEIALQAAKQERSTPVHTNNYENRNIVANNEHSNNNGNINNNLHHFNQNSKLNNLRIYSPNKLSSDESCKSNQSTPGKCNSLNNTVIENIPRGARGTPESPKSSEPPPLPPKPKILPIKPSNWGQNGLFKPRATTRNEGTKQQTLYLEQPTSSFV